jgi:hypothetical protein
MKNQYPDTVRALRPEIERVKAHLANGKPPSEIANSLHAQGLGTIQLIAVFHEATNASLGQLKTFGAWWGKDGVTDTDAFDAWAAEVLAPRESGDVR